MEETVADILQRHDRKFFHATQLQDFRVYCAEGSLLARSELEATERIYTKFFTDVSDKEKDLWDRVFGNIEDFGRLFWSQDTGVPNAYGPIMLVFDTEVWTTIDEISITERGGHHKDFDLEDEAMDPAEVNACFEEVDGEIRQIVFGLEVSSSSSRISLDQLAYVLVDPISPGFRDEVRREAEGCISDSRIIERNNYGKPLDEEKLQILYSLVGWSHEQYGDPPPSDDLKEAVPEELEDWFRKLPESLHGVLRQWLEYTYDGTLQYL